MKWIDITDNPKTTAGRAMFNDYISFLWINANLKFSLLRAIADQITGWIFLDAKTLELGIFNFAPLLPYPLTLPVSLLNLSF